MSNILAEVIQTRHAVTGDEFRDLLTSVTAKLSQIKTDLVESLQSSFVLYDSDIDKVTSWWVEILGIDEKVKGLQGKFNDDRKAIESAADDIDTLEGDLEQSEKGILILKALIKVVRDLDKAESSEFFRASELVKSSKQEFESIVELFGSTEDHAWVTNIRSKITDLTTDIYEKASKELRSIFHFHFGKNILTINLTQDVPQLIEALVNIGFSTRVINKLAIDIWQELLVKACSPDFWIEITAKPRHGSEFSEMITSEKDGVDMIPVRDGDFRNDLNLKTYENSRTIIMKAVKAAIPISEVGDVFSNVQKILFVLNQVFEKSPVVMSDFSELLGPKICEELGNKTLKNLVLRNASGDVERAKKNISIMQNYIEDFDSELNFAFPDSTIFDELDRDFDTLFAAQVKLDLLVKFRRLVKGNLHDTQEIVCDDNPLQFTEDIAALHRNPYVFSNCVVSKCVVEFVNVLKDHMKRYKEDVAMCDAAFNLYLSLVKIPKHESDSGELVPFSAVLVHNNCNYLAHHATFTFPMTEDKIPELRSKSTQAYSFMLRTVRTKLNSMISDAMTGILNNDDESSEDEINKFLKIAFEFVRLHGMLQFVLPSPSLSRTLSTLVDHTVNEMCSKVIAWEDISAACANKLASAFTQFAVETSELFKGEASNPREIEALVSKSVSKWNRFRLLAFVLTASMKEIEDRWVDGCGPLGMAFTADELRKLVRALFQNTDRRAAFLASIK